MSRILLADDDELVAELVTDAFITAGHAVGWLQNGKTALDVIKRRPPDLTILDCNMPVMSGVMVLRELRKSPTLFTLPVMMLTGRTSESDEDILRFEGANDYLRKPFEPAVLVGRAEALISGERRWN